MIFGSVRWVRCLVLVVSALAVITGQGFGQESSEIEELRALLETLEARLAVLEDGGDRRGQLLGGRSRGGEPRQRQGEAKEEDFLHGRLHSFRNDGRL